MDGLYIITLGRIMENFLKKVPVKFIIGSISLASSMMYGMEPEDRRLTPPLWKSSFARSNSDKKQVNEASFTATPAQEERLLDFDNPHQEEGRLSLLRSEFSKNHRDVTLTFRHSFMPMNSKERHILSNLVRSLSSQELIRELIPQKLKYKHDKKGSVQVILTDVENSLRSSVKFAFEAAGYPELKSHLCLAIDHTQRADGVALWNFAYPIDSVLALISKYKLNVNHCCVVARDGLNINERYLHEFSKNKLFAENLRPTGETRCLSGVSLTKGMFYSSMQPAQEKECANIFDKLKMPKQYEISMIPLYTVYSSKQKKIEWFISLRDVEGKLKASLEIKYPRKNLRFAVRHYQANEVDTLEISPEDNENMGDKNLMFIVDGYATDTNSAKEVTTEEISSLVLFDTDNSGNNTTQNRNYSELEQARGNREDYELELALQRSLQDH